MKGTYIMNTTIKTYLLAFMAISIVSISSISAMERQRDVIFLEDAIKQAENVGVSGDHLGRLRETLRAAAKTSKKGLPIDRTRAYTLIEEAQMAQVMGEVPTEEPKGETFKPFSLDQFLDKQSPIQEEFESFKTGYEKVKDDPVMGPIWGFHGFTGMIKGLKNASQSPWFYTGDLLWRYLDVWYSEEEMNPAQLIKVSSVYGPVFTQFKSKAPLSQLNLKNPFVYLVSFNQIENTCGFSALANAQAIAQQQPNTPNFKDTRTYAEAAFSKRIATLPEFTQLRCAQTGGSADAATIKKVAIEMGIDENAIETLDSKTVIQRLFPHIKHSDKFFKESATLIEKLTSQPVTYIFYDVGGGHWVLLAVATQNGVSTMYLLDANNNPLKEDEFSSVNPLIRYIDELIEASKKA